MPNESRLKMPRRAFFVMAALWALALTSCTDIVDDGPRIVAVTVDPSSLSVNETGMTDQFFEITIETAGFTAPIDGAEVTIQDVDRLAEPQDAPEITGDTIRLTRIAQSWFGGLSEGTYDLEVYVYSGDPDNPDESVRQGNAATVTVEP